MAVVKIALCYPWYSGPDPYCSIYFGERMAYFGRLQERSSWLADMPRDEALAKLPTLSPLDPLDPKADITPELVGTEFQFATAQEMFLSLVGMARDRIVERSLEWGADYLFWTDDDMIWDSGAFLSLYRNNLDICGALAFTSRVPVEPVIYSTTFVEETQKWNCEVVRDYKRDELQKVGAIGAGVMLTKAGVFRHIKPPWFSSNGSGEDIFFCINAGLAGFPTHVDTRVKTIHKAAMPTWHDESVYLAQAKA